MSAHDFDAIVGVTARLSSAAITVTDREGNPVSEGFGEIVVRAGAGRSFLVEIVEDLSGTRVSAELDLGRGRRARADLQADQLRDAIDRAARGDGFSTPLPEIER